MFIRHLFFLSPFLPAALLSRPVYFIFPIFSSLSPLSNLVVANDVVAVVVHTLLMSHSGEITVRLTQIM